MAMMAFLVWIVVWMVLICVDGYFHNGYAGFGTYQIKQSAAVVVPQEAVFRENDWAARECCKAAHVS